MPIENSLTSNSIYFEEVEDEQGLELTLEESLRNNFVGLLADRFDQAERARDIDEQRWLTAYHNYRGLYGKNVRFRESEKSRVFVKVTKTKVLAAFGQLVDVIFGGNKFPIGIAETKVPEGISEYAHLDPQNPLPGIETSQEEFRALAAYSPYHNIKDQTEYPPTLVTTADTDDRVVPGHSFKFAARLQEAQTGPNPTLIRIETRAGHGAGKPTSKIIEEIADQWAFLIKHLGANPKFDK